MDWDNIIESTSDVNEALANWSTLPTIIIENHAPMQTMKVLNTSTPWLTTELKKLARTREKLKSAAVIESYKQLRNRVNNLKKKLKRECFSNIIACNKGNLKDTWKAINLLLKKRSKTTNIVSLEVKART